MGIDLFKPNAATQQALPVWLQTIQCSHYDAASLASYANLDEGLELVGGVGVILEDRVHDNSTLQKTRNFASLRVLDI